MRESSIVGSQRPVQLESYNFFFIKLSFFSIYIFCSVVRAVRAEVLPLWIHSNFICRVTNSFELHLSSYEFLRTSLSSDEFLQSSFFELRIHSNFICWVTNSFDLHFSSYEFIRTSFVELRIHSNFICRVTNSFELHLLSYEFIRTSFVELRIHSNFICRVTNSFELHLSSYELKIQKIVLKPFTLFANCLMCFEI